MAVPQEKLFISVEDYLQGEKRSNVRHEYVDGQVFAMAGGSARHHRIVRRFGTRLENHLEDKDCEVFIADMKTTIGKGLFYYPDVVVTCEKVDDAQDTVFAPILIVEVLSPSTENVDRREKLLAYKQLRSLREYAIVWQDQIRVELHRRSNADSAWTTFLFLQRADVIELISVGLEINLVEVYRAINFGE